MKTNVPNFKIKKILTNTKVDQLLYLLILSDLVFILLHCLVRIGIFDRYYLILSLEVDQSMPEAFQYVKELWILLILGITFIKTRQPIFLLWTFLFTFFLIDDFAGIHENLGGLISPYLQFIETVNFRLKDLGEFIGVVLIGLVFSLIFLLIFMKSRRKGKRTSVTLSILVSGLLFFGIIVDLIHALFRGSSLVVNEFLSMMEDGGEMLVMSLILWYVMNMKYFNKSIFSKGYKPFPKLLPKLVL